MKKDSKEMKYGVLYACEKKDPEEYGLEFSEQVRRLRRYAKLKGITILEEFKDPKIDSCGPRGEFDRMWSFLDKNNHIKIVLVENASRLFSFEEDVEDIEELKLEIHYVGDGQISSEVCDQQEKKMRKTEKILAIDFSKEIIRVGSDQYRVVEVW